MVAVIEKFLRVPLSVFSLGSRFLCDQRGGGHGPSLDSPFSETLRKIFLDYAYASSSYLAVNLPKTAVPGKKYSQSWLKCFHCACSSSWQQAQHNCLEGADGNSCS